MWKTADELRQELARVQVEHQKALRALHTKVQHPLPLSPKSREPAYHLITCTLFN